MTALDMIAARTGNSRNAKSLVAGAVAIGVVGLLLALNANAQERFAEIHAAIDETLVVVQGGASEPIVLEAPGTTIGIGAAENGIASVALTTASEELCFFAWAKFAPLSTQVVFDDGRGGSHALIADEANADLVALEQCRGFGNGKSAVFDMKTSA